MSERPKGKPNPDQQSFNLNFTVVDGETRFEFSLDKPSEPIATEQMALPLDTDAETDQVRTITSTSNTGEKIAPHWTDREEYLAWKNDTDELAGV